MLTNLLLARLHIQCMGANNVLLLASVVVCCLSCVVVCNTLRRRNVTHQGATRDGGPVVLRTVRATPCFYRDASEVYAVIVCPSVCLSVCHKSKFYKDD